MGSRSNWKDKLEQFRIKELKDVLTQLGLPKQGKKQDLFDRIVALLSDESGSKIQGWGIRNSVDKEGLLKIIDDIHRKMQIPGATDLASKSHSNSDFNSIRPKEEVDSYQHESKIRCPCGLPSNNQSVIKCEDSRCRVWQHLNCVIIAERPVEGLPPDIPLQFYCEICRINRADPFWVTLAHRLLPVKLTSSSPALDGTMTVQNTEKTFQLTRADRELLQRSEYDLQVWCILLNDKVPFRMQWPQYAYLQVNGMAVRTTNRPGSQLLGINGRDDGPIITTCSREGLNKICLSRADSRVFCFGIRIAKRRTLQQVLSLIPNEAEGENFEDALARVRRSIGGGATEKNEDSDSDLEVVADSVTINLRCPMSASRMKIAGRFKPCVHRGCFDLETLVESNQRSRKWQCPICLKNYTLENIIIDPYFNRITSLLVNCGEDVNEIEVKPDGSWRAKVEGECGDLGRWHLPDGSLSVSANTEVKAEVQTLKQVKQEDGSDGQPRLKIGIKRNQNGIWEVRKSDSMKPPSSGNHILEKFEAHIPHIPMSSSATGSNRDGEDASVNQEGGGRFDFSLNNNHEFDSMSLNFNTECNADGSRVPSQKDADVIVLSDSDDDNVTLPAMGPAYDTSTVNNTGVPYLVADPVVSKSYPDDNGIGTSGNSCLGLLGNGDEFSMPLWSMPSCSQTGSGFQLFNTEVGVSDALAAVQPSSFDCPSISGYGLGPSDGGGSASLMGDLPSCSNNEGTGNLVDNPLAFSGEDPSLQIFLPSRPADLSMQVDMNDHVDMSHGISNDDWISLSLGGNKAGRSELPSGNGSDSRHHFLSNGATVESLADTASFLLGTNDSNSCKTTSNNKRQDGPFSHPRQPRSVRSRLVLSIDTDSDE